MSNGELSWPEFLSCRNSCAPIILANCELGVCVSLLKSWNIYTVLQSVDLLGLYTWEL